ncbi:MAG: Uma2 family endonuclease [Chloroflexota bacterium]
MASSALKQAQPYTAWPPDDTEESVVGTDRHQMTIINVRLGINELAHVAAQPGEALPWHALSQTVLIGCRRRDGTAFRTMPDVFVYKKPIDPDRGSVSLEDDGPPALIVEVASPSTFTKDLDARKGKAWSYEQAGVHEYLVLDPTGQFVPTLVWARRLRRGHYESWEPGPDGLWWSEEIPIGIGVVDGAVMVHDRAGGGLLREGEFLTSIANARLDAARAQAVAERAQAEAERERAEAARARAEATQAHEEAAELRRRLAELER